MRKVIIIKDEKETKRGEKRNEFEATAFALQLLKYIISEREGVNDAAESRKYILERRKKYKDEI